MKQPLYCSLFVFVPQLLLCLSSTTVCACLLRPAIKPRQVYIPVGLIVTGLSMNDNGKESVKNELAEERNEHIPRFHTKVDNYLQFSPIAIAYGLDAAGFSSKTDLANRTAILLKGELLMTGVVTLLKSTTHQLRPDGSKYNSLPSGHTASAFAAATFKRRIQTPVQMDALCFLRNRFRRRSIEDGEQQTLYQ